MGFGKPMAENSTTDWMIDAGEYLKTLPINEIIVDLC